MELSHLTRVLGMKSLSSVHWVPGTGRDTGENPPGYILFCSLLSISAHEYNYHLLGRPVSILQDLTVFGSCLSKHSNNSGAKKKGQQ